MEIRTFNTDNVLVFFLFLPLYKKTEYDFVPNLSEHTFKSLEGEGKPILGG